MLQNLDVPKNNRRVTTRATRRRPGFRGTSGRRSGISLIEVLVVIVILLIGIFSVIRLFPPGFYLNKQTEETTRAKRLVSLETQRLLAASANLMGAIVPVTVVQGSTGAAFAIDPSATPDDVSEMPREAYGQFPWSYYWSGPQKHRRVIDEAVRIPFPSPTAAGRGSVYMLNIGPFMDVSWDGRTRSIFIQGGPMNRDIADSTGQLNDPSGDTTRPSAFLRGQSQYGIDYAQKKICFRPQPFAREYLISFSFYTSTGVVETRVDEVVAVNANDDVWYPIPNLPIDAGEIVAYSDTVGRRFIEVAAGTWSSNDPYQFYLASPTIGNLGNVGVVVFNPLGREYTEQTNVGPQPLTAHVDYDVLDWRIIREDRSLPAARPYSVPLSLRDIKRLDDIEDDQSNYDGLIYGVAKAQNAGDFLVYNVTSGSVVPAANPNTNAPNYFVNYREGIVTFSDAFGDANRAGTFRFFYKARGEWALLAQKACGVYTRVQSPAVSYSNFWVGDGSNGSSQTRIYFPRSEAGKTITIREIWYRNAANAPQKMANKTYRIERNPSTFQLVGPYQLTYVDIAAEFGAGDPSRPTAIDFGSTGQPVLGVQGISLRTRVMWRNGGTVTQSGGADTFRSRWRKVDLDTIMTRAPAQ